jgi:hypothetical protein
VFNCAYISATVGNCTAAGGMYGTDMYSAYSCLTPATMTPYIANYGLVRSCIQKFSWTNAMVVALGGNLTGTISVCTLPANTVVRNMYLYVDTQATNGGGTLTMSVGRVGAGYTDYITAQNLMAAANTVYGGSAGHRGTNLTGYDLPSNTATTTIYAFLTSTVNNLNTITTCTGHIDICTELML